MDKLNERDKETVKKAVEQINELVKLTIDACNRDTLTKDGYSTMLCIVSKMPKNAQKNFILLCIAEGYPKETGYSVIRILGLD